MRIRLIGHSGLYVELKEINLSFDYYRSELPVPGPDKPLFVFVSHTCPGHFQRSVFSLAERADNVVCSLSDNIRRSALPFWIQGNAKLFAPETEAELCHLVWNAKSGEPRQETFLKVNACRSTGEDVAFLVNTAGAHIYHAGDLNDWHWEENTVVENNAQRTLYPEELREIRTEVERSKRVPDIVLMSVGSRLGADYWRGTDAYMREVGTRYLMPMHLYGDASMIQKLREREASHPYRDRILGTGREGEVFTP